jgi:hypothetical protein
MQMDLAGVPAVCLSTLWVRPGGSPVQHSVHQAVGTPTIQKRGFDGSLPMTYNPVAELNRD